MAPDGVVYHHPPQVFFFKLIFLVGAGVGGGGGGGGRRVLFVSLQLLHVFSLNCRYENVCALKSEASFFSLSPFMVGVVCVCVWGGGGEYGVCGGIWSWNFPPNSQIFSLSIPYANVSVVPPRGYHGPLVHPQICSNKKAYSPHNGVSWTQKLTSLCRYFKAVKGFLFRPGRGYE